MRACTHTVYIIVIKLFWDIAQNMQQILYYVCRVLYIYIYSFFASFQMMTHKWRIMYWSVVWRKAVMSQNLQNTALTQVGLPYIHNVSLLKHCLQVFILSAQKKIILFFLQLLPIIAGLIWMIQMSCYWFII